MHTQLFASEQEQRLLLKPCSKLMMSCLLLAAALLHLFLSAAISLQGPCQQMLGAMRLLWLCQAAAELLVAAHLITSLSLSTSFISLKNSCNSQSKELWYVSPCPASNCACARTTATCAPAKTSLLTVARCLYFAWVLISG